MNCETTPLLACFLEQKACHYRDFPPFHFYWHPGSLQSPRMKIKGGHHVNRERFIELVHKETSTVNEKKWVVSRGRLRQSFEREQGRKRTVLGM